MTKLSRALECASDVCLNSYAIDEFDLLDNPLVIGCSGVIEFMLEEQEVELDEEGAVQVSGLAREGLGPWEKFEGYWLALSVNRPMRASDCD